MINFQNRFSQAMILMLWICLMAGPSIAASPVPQKIVSLGPIITDMIYLLKAEDRLVAVTSYCRLADDSAPKQVVGTVMQMNVEKIISLEPDLVLANALTSQKQIDALSKQGLTVLRLPTPRTFDDICQRLIDLGNLIGKPEKALAVVSHAREQVSQIKSKALAGPKRKVFIQIGIKPLKTAAKDTFINEYIEFAGGINIVSQAKDGVYSREKVLEQNPDVIFIATMGTSQKAGASEKSSWQRFKFLKAVKNKEIHILDPDMVCSPTPDKFSNGLVEFFRLIHPVKEKKL
ncbi:MAG: helical backbone metal receptor [Pseudomonadota bacterium]